jgi:hypothetical protein
LQPLSPETIAAVLERPVGNAVRAPRVAGHVDIKGKKAYIAEYLVLVDVGGEVTARGQAGQLLGQSISGSEATLVYRADPDIAALQALVDRAWADLGTRLQAAGVVLTEADKVLSQFGAVYPATEPASTPGAPVFLEAKVGDTSRQYLAMAPTGMKIVKRTLAGIGPGNVAARVAFPAQGVEGLSLAMAIHLSAMDATGQRQGSLQRPDGSTGPAQSPMMELAPAPNAALVHSHSDLSLVNLGEALLLAGEFGRLRPADRPHDTSGKDPLAPLLSIGRKLIGGNQNTRVDAHLDLDGPTTARLMLYLASAANQAMADVLKAAQ